MLGVSDATHAIVCVAGLSLERPRPHHRQHAQDLHRFHIGLATASGVRPRALGPALAAGFASSLADLSPPDGLTD